MEPGVTTALLGRLSRLPTPRPCPTPFFQLKALCPLPRALEWGCALGAEPGQALGSGWARRGCWLLAGAPSVLCPPQQVALG